MPALVKGGSTAAAPVASFVRKAVKRSRSFVPVTRAPMDQVMAKRNWASTGSASSGSGPSTGGSRASSMVHSCFVRVRLEVPGSAEARGSSMASGGACPVSLSRFPVSPSSK